MYVNRTIISPEPGDYLSTAELPGQNKAMFDRRTISQGNNGLRNTMYNSAGPTEEYSSAVGELSPIASVANSQYPMNKKLGSTMMDQEMK